MTAYGNALDYVQDQERKGVEFPFGANVEIIRLIGIRVVEGRIPSSVRKELNKAVKDGYLGRSKRNGIAPEIYFHPNSRPRAISKRNEIVRNAAEVLGKIYI